MPVLRSRDTKHAQKEQNQHRVTKPPKQTPRPKDASQAQSTASIVATLEEGDNLEISKINGNIETEAGKKVSVASLLAESENGIIIFTYPKASTPGCTTQACLFRDSHQKLKASGFDVYGLSKDTAKANSSFKAKQKLTYTMLCDPSLSLIGALGLRKKPSGTVRGVCVIDKAGKILAIGRGGPAKTLEVAQTTCENAV